jgi:lysophospholipase L1-like esterase
MICYKFSTSFTVPSLRLPLRQPHMMHYSVVLAILTGTSVLALPQQDSRAWAQCGGTGYSGLTTCPANYHCEKANDFYSQCIPGAGSASSTTSASKTSATSSSKTSALTVSSSTKMSTTTASSTTKPTSATSTSTKASATPSGSTFRYLGRVNPATKELTWPASGITFTFTGTSASVPITSITGANAIIVSVDGVVKTIDNVTGSSITTGTLSQGLHTVEIRKKSEASFGSIVIGNPTTSGTFSPVTQPKKRIEIIGDSISVGYGLDGTYPCTNTASLENAPQTYGALTAKNLSADYSIVAWSGKGIIRNYVTATGDDGQPTVPELWTRYGANDADNTYDFKTPVDIVVVNLGTNDFGFMSYDANGVAFQARPLLDMTDYTKALVKFGKAIQGKYPSAELFITSSPLIGDGYPPEDPMQKTKQQGAIKAAVAQIGAKAHFVDFPSQDSSNNNIGCDYHPSALTQQRDAVILTSAIRAVTG